MEVRTGSVFRRLSSTAHVFTVNLGQPGFPKLKSLTFDGFDFSAEAVKKLLDVVVEMCDLNRLTMRWCEVPQGINCRADFENVVQNVTWDCVTEMGPWYYRAESEEDRSREGDFDAYDYGCLGGL